MSLPEKVAISTSKLTAIGDAIRSRFGVSGDLTLDEMAYDVENAEIPFLPDTYQQVDYIESSGTQYIDTGFKASKYTAIRLDFMFTYIDTNNNYLFGMDVSGVAANFFGAYIESDGRVRCSQPYQTGYGFYYPTTAERYNFAFGGGNYSISNDTGCWGLQMNGSYGNPNEFDNAANLNLFLFACNKSGTAGNFTRYKLYKCQIFNNGTGETHRDFIPCYRKSDNEIGLYDTVRKQFYTNAGSGSFTCYPAPN